MVYFLPISLLVCRPACLAQYKNETVFSSVSENLARETCLWIMLTARLETWTGATSRDSVAAGMRTYIYVYQCSYILYEAALYRGRESD